MTVVTAGQSIDASSIIVRIRYMLRLDSEEFDVEEEGGVARDDAPRSTAAVPQLWRYRDLAALTDLRNRACGQHKRRRHRNQQPILSIHYIASKQFLLNRREGHRLLTNIYSSYIFKICMSHNALDSTTPDVNKRTVYVLICTWYKVYTPSGLTFHRQ